MPEWSNGPHSKCGVLATVPGVRIPPSPPSLAEAPRIRGEGELRTFKSHTCRNESVWILRRASVARAIALATERGQGPLDKSWTVYILACADGSHYVRCTSHLLNRLERHCRGWVPATKARLPCELVTFIVFNDKYRAYAFEKYLKSGSGRAFAKKRLN